MSNYGEVKSIMRHLLGDDFELVVNQSGLDHEKFEAFCNLMLEGSDAEAKSLFATVKHVASSM